VRPPTAVSRPAATESSGPYAGLITRAIAFLIDAAIVNTIAIIVSAAVLLGLSILPGQQKLHAFQVVLAGAAFVIWCVAYWSVFWSTTGQTPGDRVMRIRVLRSDGETLHWLRSIVRVWGAFIAALPLLAGFLPILVTERRRGLHDWIAGTVVVYTVDVIIPPAAGASANGVPEHPSG
jgi:uncharacterized RDD family membrane protein YckC